MGLGLSDHYVHMLFIQFKNFSNMLQRVKKWTIQRIKCTEIYLLNQLTWQELYVISDVNAKFNNTFLYIFHYNDHYYFVVSCQIPFLPGAFPLEKTVIPTVQASSFTLQYFCIMWDVKRTVVFWDESTACFQAWLSNFPLKFC